ncbi:MAG: SBBP repeat-containing protein [Bacteroidales bacterium]|nr:SBBP repeat-containing protein [Bacteroidales bacterium]
MNNVFLIFGIISFGVVAGKPISESLLVLKSVSKLERTYFIENKGQWPDEVFYLCKMHGINVWITKYGINYTFYRSEERIREVGEGKGTKWIDEMELYEDVVAGHRVLMEFKEHNLNPVREGRRRAGGYYNYLTNDGGHVREVGLFREVILKDVYDGIDVRYYFDGGELRYEWIVREEGNVNKIKFTLRGMDRIKKENGSLTFETQFGMVEIENLLTYDNDGVLVKSWYEERERTWGFGIEKCDYHGRLVIKPLMHFRSFGQYFDEQAEDIVVDGTGCAYITGYTWSEDYDVTIGSFQNKNDGEYDVFVTKLNNSGTALVYSTYLGGKRNDYSFGITVDSMGCVYITGETYSADFNVTIGSFQTWYGGKGDAFIAKLNNTGTRLMYSTFLGGSENDAGSDISVDNKGCVYVTGLTESDDFDVTSGAYQTIAGKEKDAYVAKLNSSGTALMYSTYLGGSDADYGYDIAVDGTGCAYITGWTKSVDFDVTVGAYQVKHGGEKYDVFVTKLNSDGTSLVYSTYLGGSGNEWGWGITVDDKGYAYVTGFTESTDFDVTKGAYQEKNAGGYDAFITKLNNVGTELVYSTYLGGNGNEWSSDIAVNNAGFVFITGFTESNDFDVTSKAYERKHGGGDKDVFVTKLNILGTGLIYSTYLGGDSDEWSWGIAIDGTGNAYVAGCTRSRTFDVTVGAYQKMMKGFNDVFVTKIHKNGKKLIYSTYLGGQDS